MKKIGRRETVRVGSRMVVANEALRDSSGIVADHVARTVRDALRRARRPRFAMLRLLGEPSTFVSDSDPAVFIRDETLFVAKQSALVAFIGGHPTGTPRGKQRRRR